MATAARGVTMATTEATAVTMAATVEADLLPVPRLPRLLSQLPSPFPVRQSTPSAVS